MPKEVWLILRRLGMAAAAAAILWVLYATGPLARLDQATFLFLNGLLGKAVWFDRIMIFLNLRAVDYSFAALMGLAYFGFALRGGRERFLPRFKFGLIIIAILVPIIVLNKTVDDDIGRHNPARVYEATCVNLEKVHPDVPQHHTPSGDCFPGDHAVVWFSFIWIALYARRSILPWLILVAAIFMTPRLVVGGHWLTDLMGAAVIAYILPAILDAFLHFGDAKWGLQPRFSRAKSSSRQDPDSDDQTRRIVPGMTPRSGD